MSDVRISERRTETGNRVDIAQGTNHVRLADPDHSQHVVSVRRQARALSDQIEDTEFARDPGVFQLKIRIEIDHPVVPLQSTAIDHDGKRRAKKGFSGRADLKDSLDI